MLTLKKYHLLILIFLISLTLASCSNKSMAKPPEISITAGNKEIVYVVGLNKWDGAIYDREDTFHTIMKKTSAVELPYIQLGETIQIVFRGTAPGTIKLKDYILRENGDLKYAEKVAKEIPIELKNAKATFKLDAHMASFLSSHTKDYEPGKTIRGLRLTCGWGDNECEYGFIIRTDSGSKLFSQ